MTLLDNHNEVEDNLLPEAKPMAEDKVYGIEDLQLDANYQVRNIPETKIFIDSFTWLSSSGTGDWSYTGVGFKPKLVVIEAIRSPNAVDPIFCLNNTMEDGVGGFNYAEIYKDNVNKAYTGNSLALRVTDAGGTPGTTATMTSFDSDGFTLNFATASWNVGIKLTCYG